MLFRRISGWPALICYYGGSLLRQREQFKNHLGLEIGHKVKFGLVTKFLQSIIRHTLSSVSQSVSQTVITHPVCILGFVETRIKHVNLEWPNSSNTIYTEVT